MIEAGNRVSELGKRWEGQLINGKFPLIRYLGQSDHSIVFLTERKQEPRKAAIKLIPAAGLDEASQLSQWEAAAKLSHPHLIELFEVGRWQLGNEARLYVVMEYADEDLSQVLPIRQLTTVETREMLLPVLDALGYLHSKGFVHGHIKPANIVAVGNQLKISRDGVVRADQASGARRVPSLYDPPEAGSTGTSAAGDLWSLGVTLVEALTQRRPVREPTPGGEVPLPLSLPAPFSDIAGHCLARNPEERWSIHQISARLESLAASKPAEIVGPRQGTFEKRGWIVAAVVLLALLAVLAISRPWHHASEVQQSPPVSAPASAPESTQASAPSAVVQQVLPDVPRSASNTIHGTIRVKVRVAVDSSGNVSNATFVTPGPSRYFANLALQSARKWKFTPAKADVPNQWILSFEFRQSGTHASANSTSQSGP
jgi:TonB family protein